MTSKTIVYIQIYSQEYTASQVYVKHPKAKILNYNRPLHFYISQSIYNHIMHKLQPIFLYLEKKFDINYYLNVN